MINTTFQINYFGISDPGQVRDHNEDRWLAYPEHSLFLLADGMGGHAAGDVAASEAVARLAELVDNWHPPHKVTSEEAMAFFYKAFEKVNSTVYRKGQEDSSLSGMGTTLCALFFLNNNAVIAHAGDSRIYRLRSQKLCQLTEDHSLLNELLSVGAISQKVADRFPYKHILTRAIGTHSTIDPTVQIVDVELDDLYLLCSDGLSNYVSDKEITRILNQTLSLKERGHQLIDLANEHGGGDNITALLTQIEDDLPR